MGFAEEVITKYYGILFDPELNDTYRFTVEVVEEGDKVSIDVKLIYGSNDCYVKYGLSTSPEDYVESAYLYVGSVTVGKVIVKESFKKPDINYQNRLIEEILDEIEKVFKTCGLVYFNKEKKKRKTAYIF